MTRINTPRVGRLRRVKAHGLDANEWDRSTLPNGLGALATAVVAQGLLDATKGEADALEWLGARDFDDWCDRAGLHPDAMRRKVKPLLPAVTVPRRGGGKFSEEDIADMLRRREEGYTWPQIAASHGTTQTSARAAVERAGYKVKELKKGAHGDEADAWLKALEWTATHGGGSDQVRGKG